jgi:UDP-glucose 4-epimerase
MRTVVTGGSGFIGGHLVDRLADLGWAVTVLDHRDRARGGLPAGVRQVPAELGDAPAVAQALAGAEVVVHLAWTSIHEASNRDPAADVAANVLPSLSLLAACHRAGVRRVLFVSSGGTVYGPARVLPIPEEHPTEPDSAYGINKLAVEKYLRLAHHLQGLEPVVLRPSVAYGPGQSPFRRQGAVAVFLHRVANGLPLTVYGDGSVSRDYFYVADLVEALVAAIQRPAAAPGLYNIGGPAEVSLTALIEAVERTVGRAAELRFEPARPFDAPRIVLDTSRARSALGWAPRTGLDEGLDLTWRWMREAIP